MGILQVFAAKWLWPATEPTNPGLRRLLVVGRYLFALARDLLGGELTMRVMSLVWGGWLLK